MDIIGILPLQGANRLVAFTTQGVAIGLGYKGLSAQQNITMIKRTTNDQDFRHEVAIYPSPAATPWGYKTHLQTSVL